MARADLIVRGGTIFTADPARPRAQALAVAGERIVAVGDEKDVRDLADARTRVVELGRGMCLPGFHDAHTHLMGAGLVEDELDLTGTRDEADLVARVAARARDGAWVLGRGFDPDLMGGWPTRMALDRAAPRSPVLLVRRDGHAAVAGTRALELAAITSRTVDPAGGKIVRDASGAPTGVLLEDAAIDLVRGRVPKPSLDARARAAERGLTRARALGITSIQDDESWDDALRPVEAYAELLRSGRLTARVTLWQRLGRARDELRRERASVPEQRGAPRLACGLEKGYLDGSLGSRTALVCEPYEDDRENRGVARAEPAALITQVREAHAAGAQVGLHAIGDRAVEIALDAYEALAREVGVAEVRGRRHRIEHAQIVRPEDVARFAALGVVASVQPVHLSSDMLIARERLGARCASSYPWRAFRDAGVTLAFGSDFPVEPLEPLRGIACAVERRSFVEPARPSFFPEQAVTLDDALVAFTRGAAFAAHQEGDRGRIAPGFLADLAVLDRDLFAIPAAEIASSRARVTIVGGEVVHDG
jgi:predicted amidohydrolase YtcJ